MRKTAVISGVGPGLGASLVRKFAQEGCQVGMLARSQDYLQNLAKELQEENATALAVPTDISDKEQVARAFEQVQEAFGPVDILVNHAGSGLWKDFLEMTPEDFEQSWRVCAYGAFLCCQQAVPDMLKSGSGTILFTGATSSIRGRENAPAFSSAKFAVRGFAWSLARQLWPKGIHVAHVIIDGVLDTPSVRAEAPSLASDPLIDTDAAAHSYWHLVQQDRSAWTFELDLRAHEEEFFT